MIRIVWPWFFNNITAIFGKYSGISLFGLVIVKDKSKLTHRLINHELIHFFQQVETLFVGFFIIYLVSYLYNLVKYRNHDKAYRAIPFEQEAYACESDYKYLFKRKLHAWILYLTK